MDMRVLGITLVFNEADCVKNALGCLSRVCDQVVAFDHGSTDGTMDIINGYGGAVKLVRWERRKVSYGATWGRISRYIRAQEGFDWVVWISADEVLRQASGKLIDRAALVDMHRRGIRVIRPLGREFWITELDGDEPNCIDRMEHYYFPKVDHSPRAWQHGLTGVLPWGLHRYDPQWKIPLQQISRGDWLLDHYPLRTVEQARRKIMHERIPRAKYMPYRRAKCRNVVKQASTLTRLELPHPADTIGAAGA